MTQWTVRIGTALALGLVLLVAGPGSDNVAVAVPAPAVVAMDPLEFCIARAQRVFDSCRERGGSQPGCQSKALARFAECLIKASNCEDKACENED